MNDIEKREASNHNTIKMLILNNFIFLNESWINFFLKNIFTIFLSSSTSLSSTKIKSMSLQQTKARSRQSLTQTHTQTHNVCYFANHKDPYHACVGVCDTKHSKWKNHIMTIVHIIMFFFGYNCSLLCVACFVFCRLYMWSWNFNVKWVSY